MSKESGKVQTTTTSDNAPWSQAQPYITNLMTRAKELSQRPSSQLVGPLSGDTQTAMGMTRNRAIQGSPLMGDANNLARNTLQGDFLSPDSNPYLAQYFQRGMEQMSPSINATFGGAGRTGSNAHATALGRGAADLATGIYGGAYDSERGRQMQGLAMAPTMAANDYADINALYGMGQMTDNRAQQMADSDWTLLNRYASALGGGYGSSGTSTQTQPTFSNPLGGAMGGAMMGSMLGPWGTAGGAILGGLFG